jgi:predicted  nucleic acid-binding Zn-ribbon protein
MGLKGVTHDIPIDMSIRDVLIGMEPRSHKEQKPTTLEAHHQQKMREFKDLNQSLASLTSQLSMAEARIAGLSAAAAFSDEARILSDEVDSLREAIHAIKTDTKRLDYFLEVGDMLFQYYEAQDSVARGSMDLTPSPPMRMPANSVLSYFTDPAISVSASATSNAVAVTQPAKQRASEIDITEGMNRDKMLERYLATVEPSAIKSGIMPGSGIEPGWGSCPRCDVEMTFYQNEALLGCPRCGHEEFILIDSEKPSYKDPPREITYFAYKKINHFNEWLAQFQAKENTDIPQDVIDSVMKELRKERISDPKKVKKEKIREILQKLKCSKMYDHVPQIKNRIQHQMTNLTLSKEMEEKLQYLFKEIQPAFIKYCPANRSNFLSYPYVLYKLCQLLEMDEFLPCFQLLKSREKLYQQDQVWQNICQEMRWQFIRSI